MVTGLNLFSGRRYTLLVIAIITIIIIRTHLQQSFHWFVIPYCSMNHRFKGHVTDSYIRSAAHKKLNHGVRAILRRPE